MCSIPLRMFMMALLVGCFVTQTWLIYTDETGYSTGPLSVEGLKGRTVWQQHNCQSCHQLYGFGGFLGPDLTNRAANLPLVAFDAILKAGPKQMPKFHLSRQETQNLHLFLKAMNETGKSQPKHSDYNPPGNQVLSFQTIPWFIY